MKRQIFLIITFCCLTGVNTITAQQKSPEINSQDLKTLLPLDPKVTVGKLENGLTYYIRTNQKPEKRAELRLVVNAGSVLEDDDQNGLAHLCEHMAFNGTKNFSKQELVNYLESIGMRFGPELNAYTSFDETVYMLTVPTDNDSMVRTAFQILEDWAHNVSYDSVEVDKERGVVIEEWRLGRGAGARMMDKQFPIMFKGSKYADRNVIGKKEILESFKHETLKSYYKDWYRPDLMAVVAIGDFDKSEIENVIKKHFSKISSATNKRPREIFPVPNHKEALFAIATDIEATMSMVSVYYKHELQKEKTVDDYRKKIVEGLYDGMFNSRLEELTRKSDPPFLYAYSGGGRFVRSKEIYLLTSAVKDNGIERGFETLLTEAARIKKFGFTPTELERQKKELMRSMEQAYNERDKTESRNFTFEYVANFLDEEPIPGIEYEYKLHQQYLPGITLEEVNQLASERISEENRVVMVNAPEKKDLKVPTQEELSKIFKSVETSDIKAYDDKVTTDPLVANPPAAGMIAGETMINDLGVTEWKLSNGVRVILKPTDFKNDEIMLSAFSPGGTSLVDDNNYVAASSATTIVAEGGVGKFDQTTLQKMLQGKIVNVFPFISELDEGFSGSCSPKDFETMMQLIYAYVTSPRMDSTAYLSYMEKMKAQLKNRNARPETAFEDTLQVTLTQYNYRRRPWSEELLKEMNLRNSFKIYRDRFSDAADFIFIIDGAFKPEEIKSAVLTYLGGLPSNNRKENWKDVGITPPRGVIKKTVNKGIEAKSSVRIVFTGPFDWTRENRHSIQSMAGVLRIKLREALREEKGGTYGVGVGASTWQFPRPEYRLTVSWGCSPDRVEELIKTAMEQIDSVKNFGVSDIYITKVKETQKREREVSLKENRFWLSSLQFAYSNHEDPMNILKYDELIEKVNSGFVQKAAQKYFDMNNYVQAILYPEEKK